MQIYRADRYKKMPWKNGLGTTTELFIYPQTSSIADMRFTWRLSSADLPLKSEFSKFSGYKRFLTLIRGNSMNLNNSKFSKFEVAHFSGDEATNCVCDKEQSLDIGLIYDPQKVNPIFRIIQTPESVSEDALIVYLGSGYQDKSIHLNFLDSLEVKVNFKVPASIEHPFLSVYGSRISFSNS